MYVYIVTRILLQPLKGAYMSNTSINIPINNEAEPLLPDEELLYDLADLFKVFSDTTRIKILYSLMDQNHCVAEIAQIVNATQSAVSHQLRILKQSRLVRANRSGRSIIYALADDHVHTILATGMEHICE